MRGFLYKNIVLYKGELIIIGVIQLFISVIAIVSCATANLAPSESFPCLALFFSVFLMASLFEYQLFLPDEKKTVSSFIFSTPNGVNNHVICKYITLLFVNLLILLCCFFTDVIAHAVSDSSAKLAISTYVMFFFVGLIFAAYSTPFYLRFGIVAGNSAKYGFLGIIAVLLGVYALFGDMSFLTSGRFNEFVLKITSSSKLKWYPLIAFPITCIICYLSYRFSLVLYRKGAETFDK